MNAILNLGEGAWWCGAGCAVLAQFPVFDPSFNNVVSVIGAGLLMSRIVDSIIRYPKGMAETDNVKLGLYR